MTVTFLFTVSTNSLHNHVFLYHKTQHKNLQDPKWLLFSADYVIHVDGVAEPLQFAQQLPFL